MEVIQCGSVKVRTPPRVLRHSAEGGTSGILCVGVISERNVCRGWGLLSPAAGSNRVRLTSAEKQCEAPSIYCVCVCA